MGRSRERQRGALLSRAVRALYRVLSRRPEEAIYRSGDRQDYSRHDGLPEEEAARIALMVTHEVREEMGRGLEPEERLPAPSPEEVRKRREERRRREDEGHY